MSELKTESIPLHADEYGVLRVAHTRVSLDSLVYSFLNGASPETIADQFDAVGLSDIYLVLGYYLKHKAEVDDYLLKQSKEGEKERQRWEEPFPAHEFRERLLTRKRLQTAS